MNRRPSSRRMDDEPLVSVSAVARDSQKGRFSAHPIWAAIPLLAPQVDHINQFDFGVSRHGAKVIDQAIPAATFSSSSSGVGSWRVRRICFMRGDRYRSPRSQYWHVHGDLLDLWWVIGKFPSGNVCGQLRSTSRSSPIGPVLVQGERLTAAFRKNVTHAQTRVILTRGCRPTLAPALLGGIMLV